MTPEEQILVQDFQKALTKTKTILKSAEQGTKRVQKHIEKPLGVVDKETITVLTNLFNEFHNTLKQALDTIEEKHGGV